MKDPKTMSRLAEMVRLYSACLRITERLLRSSEGRDQKQRAALLEKRARMIARAESVRSSLATETRGDEVLLAGVSEEQKPKAEAALRKIGLLMEAVVQRNNRLANVVEMEMDQVGGQLQRYRKGRSTVKSLRSLQ